MVDLFADIPEEVIESTLQAIRMNLDKVNLYGGHTLKKHTDIQVQALKYRLTQEDIRFATSFWDMEVATAIAQEMMQTFYESEIKEWLRGKDRDSLSLIKNFKKNRWIWFSKRRRYPAGKSKKSMSRFSKRH